MMPKHQPRIIEASSGPQPQPPTAVRAQWSVVLLGLREARGVTQDGWAALLGYGRATVQRWEREEAVPNADAVETLVRLCREEGLLRRFERGRLRGMTLTADLLRELMARWQARIKHHQRLAGDHKGNSLVRFFWKGAGIADDSVV
jgi:transcriptional regulator with XRE-family HTH domain